MRKGTKDDSSGCSKRLLEKQIGEIVRSFVEKPSSGGVSLLLLEATLLVGGRVGGAGLDEVPKH